MSKLEWDAIANRPYDAGIDRGVLYPKVGPGVPWNGIINIQELVVEANGEAHYYDGIKYRQTGKMGSFAAVLEAFSYPEEFEAYDGLSGNLSHQKRETFGLSYRTTSGSGGYKIHLVYNAMAAPSKHDHKSITGSAEPDTFSWGISTTPIPIPGAKASAHLIIDSEIALPSLVLAFEDILYGNETVDATLPSPADVLEFFESNAILRITDNGDGTWTAEGPDAVIIMLDATTFEISWPSAVYVDTDEYQISSL